MKARFCIIAAAILLLSGCQTESHFASSSSAAPSSSMIENTDTVDLLDGVPCFRGEPLLETVQLDPEYAQYQEALRRWIGREGESYQFDRLMDASFQPEDIENMDPAEVEFSYNDGSGIPETLDAETRGKLTALQLDESILTEFINCGLMDFLLSLDTEQAEALRNLTADLDANLEFMGLTHSRQTMMASFEETIRTALAQPEDAAFRAQAEEKGIPHWKQDALLKRGYLRSEILTMTEKEQDAALIPAATPAWSSYYICDYALLPLEEWSLTKAGYTYLEKRAQETGISSSEIERLPYLGYTSYDTIMLSEEEWYFLFPLAALPEKLNLAGFSDEMIAQWEPRLKYLVKEALKLSDYQ